MDELKKQTVLNIVELLKKEQGADRVHTVWKKGRKNQMYRI